MDSWQLKIFLTIADCGSITQAAERLGTSQPAVSQQLARLEESLGNIPLFDRGARGVRQTEAGRKFAEHARNILRITQRAQADLLREDHLPSGPVTLCMPSSACQTLAVPLVQAVLKKLPQVKLRIQEVSPTLIAQWLIERRPIDLAVMFYAEQTDSVTSRWITDEMLYLVGPHGAFGPVDEHGIALEPVDPVKLGQLDMILPGQQHGLRRYINERAFKLPYAFNVIVEADSLPQIRSLVSAGIGYSILGHSAVSEDLQRGKLSVASFTGVRFVRSVSLARNPETNLTRAALEVEDLLFELAREMIADGRWHTGIS